MDKTEKLKQIKEEVVNLKRSPLYSQRIKNGVFPVIGEGSHDAKVMFIGEAPGAREAATGRPFCGSAGKVLDWCLEKSGIEREEVYITNILKDRPPKNRDPLPEEIEVYSPFLDRQIRIISPEIIVCLGRFSSEYILSKFGLEKELAPISTLRGRVFTAKTDYGNIKIIPMLHPAVGVYNPSKKDSLVGDFAVVKNNLSLA